MNVIAAHPPAEMYKTGLEIGSCCARCGSSMDGGPCEFCEDGFDGHDCGDDCCCCLYPEDNVRCEHCDGTGVWHQCLSSPEFCQANPLPGRENVQRGQIEWFTHGREEVR